MKYSKQNSNPFEDAAKLLNKTVDDLKQQKRRLEIDIISFDGQVKETQRKLYHLGGNLSMLKKQKETLEEKIIEETEAMKTTKSQHEEEIANKKNLAEIEILNNRKDLDKIRDELNKKREIFYTEKKALEIYELDLKNYQKEIDEQKEELKEELKVKFKKIEILRQEFDFKEESLALRSKSLDERHQDIRNLKLKFKKDEEKSADNLKRSQDKLDQANDFLKVLNDKSLQLQKYQKNIELKNETLNKKAFIIEGKERDLRKRELLLKDRESTLKTHLNL